MIPFYQDRLGTDIGNALKKRDDALFLTAVQRKQKRRALRAGAALRIQAWYRGAYVRRVVVKELQRCGKCLVLNRCCFILENEDLPRQAWDRHRKNAFSAGRRRRCGCVSRRRYDTGALFSLFGVTFLSYEIRSFVKTGSGRQLRGKFKPTSALLRTGEQADRVVRCCGRLHRYHSRERGERKKRHFGGWLDYFLRMKRDGHLPRQARDEHNEA
jgi:hypothetical protein